MTISVVVYFILLSTFVTNAVSGIEIFANYQLDHIKTVYRKLVYSIKTGNILESVHDNTKIFNQIENGHDSISNGLGDDHQSDDMNYVNSPSYLKNQSLNSNIPHEINSQTLQNQRGDFDSLHPFGDLTPAPITSSDQPPPPFPFPPPHLPPTPLPPPPTEDDEGGIIPPKIDASFSRDSFVINIESGRPGVPGFSGEMGYPGFEGARGQPGRNGRHGEEGPPGVRGRDGQKGDPGDPGYPGVAGPMGPPGGIGPPGQCGQPGDPGLKGPYDYCKITCPPCPNGKRGPKGRRGNPGKDGRVITKPSTQQHLLEEKASSGLNIYIIVGIIAGALLIFIIFFIVVAVIIRKRE